jgi:hypothetical protein
MILEASRLTDGSRQPNILARSSDDRASVLNGTEGRGLKSHRVSRCLPSHSLHLFDESIEVGYLQ